MTQNRPPTRSGPAPEESLAARFAGQTSDAGVEDQPGTVSEPARPAPEAESEGTTEAGEPAGETPEQPVPAIEEEAPVETADGQDLAGDTPAPPGTDAAEQAAEQDTRSREEILAALRAAEDARDEYLEDLRRTQAEFQNFRKRTMREGALQREQGTIDVLSRLVDVVDDFELAVLATGSASEVASLRKGVEMVYGKFVEVLQSFGLEKIGQEGVPFDPQRHDAVQRVEDGEEHGEPVVAEVLRPGYLMGGRVLRPAMVKVVT